MRLTKKNLAKYRDFTGTLIKHRKCWFTPRTDITLENERGERVKVRSGNAGADQMKTGTVYTIGHIGKRLINIRPGRCEHDTKE